jgi:hypothetical protein
MIVKWTEESGRAEIVWGQDFKKLVDYTDVLSVNGERFFIHASGDNYKISSFFCGYSVTGLEGYRTKSLAVKALIAAYEKHGIDFIKNLITIKGVHLGYAQLLEV